MEGIYVAILRQVAIALKQLQYNGNQSGAFSGFQSVSHVCFRTKVINISVVMGVLFSCHFPPLFFSLHAIV